MALVPPEPCPRRPVFQLGRWWHSSIRVPWLQPAILGYGLGHHVGRARPWRDAGGGPWPCPSARWRAPARAARPRPRSGVAGIKAGTRRGRTPAGLGSGEGAGAQRGRADRAPPSAGAACPGSWRSAGASAPDTARTRSVRVCGPPARARRAPARSAGSARPTPGSGMDDRYNGPCAPPSALGAVGPRPTGLGSGEDVAVPDAGAASLGEGAAGPDAGTASLGAGTVGPGVGSAGPRETAAAGTFHWRRRRPNGPPGGGWATALTAAAKQHGAARVSASPFGRAGSGRLVGRLAWPVGRLFWPAAWAAPAWWHLARPGLEAGRVGRLGLVAPGPPPCGQIGP